MGEAKLMDDSVLDQLGVDRTTYRLGRFFFHWCLLFGFVILLSFQSLTALIVPSASEYEVSGPVSLLATVAFGILTIYLGATTHRMVIRDAAVIEGRQGGVRIAVLLVFSVVVLIRGIWWIVDVLGGNAATFGNYVGMAWFTIAGLIGIPLAIRLASLRNQ
ncbi:hypothetical protein WBG06_09620 [Nocardioides sp. CCNWLW239]|uniref:hypothetical protein n=1 Tax=Nocardioides sp. CCNWLW239 TaxID=3128902 RepID=UPI003019D94B